MSGFWKIIAGTGNQYIADFQEKKCIAIGWTEMGDLSGVRDSKDMERMYGETYPQLSAGKHAAGLGNLRRFLFDMKKGDVVISYDPGTREYIWGEITGDYAYDPKRIPDLPNARSVKWTAKVSRDDLSDSTRNRLTVLLTIIQPSRDIYEEFQAIISGKKAPPPETPAVDLFRDQEEKAHELIKDKINRLDWQEMQDLFAAILRAMGYKTRVSPAGPDKGKDVVASRDGLNLEVPRIKAEVKHRKQVMGAPDVRSFIGGLRPGDTGIYVSTGGFTKEAEYVADQSNIPCTLVDLDRLAEILVQHYDRLDSEGQALIPLGRIYWPTN